MWYKTLVVLQCMWCSFLGADDMVDGQNQFAFHLLKKVSRENENLCFSPYSIANALTLAYLGAEGQTKNEIGMLFSYPPQDSNLVLSHLKALDTFLRPALSSANLVVIDQSFKPLESYLDQVKALDAKLFSIDTTNDASGSVASMNNWVKEKTQGYIPDLLMPQDINSLTKMVLLNAVYLKADWQSPFDAAKTKDDAFQTATNETLKVAMMCKTEPLTLYQDGDVSVVWKDMKAKSENGPEIQAVIIVPETATSRTMLQNTFSMELLERYKQNASRKMCELFFPKCFIRKRMELKNTLMALGMKEAFQDGADFTAIEPTLPLVIQQVIHEGYMSFNETGVVAAAATAVTMGLTAFLPDQAKPVVIRCDKPFYVIILEKKTNLALFVGYVARPVN